MLNQIRLLVLCLIFRGFVVFTVNTGHLLNRLLALEFIAVFIYTLLGLRHKRCFIILFYLVLVVCEGVLGLSLLVVMAAYYRGDFLKSARSVVC